MNGFVQGLGGLVEANTQSVSLRLVRNARGKRDESFKYCDSDLCSYLMIINNATLSNACPFERQNSCIIQTA